MSAAINSHFSQFSVPAEVNDRYVDIGKIGVKYISESEHQIFLDIFPWRKLASLLLYPSVCLLKHNTVKYVPELIISGSRYSSTLHPTLWDSRRDSCMWAASGTGEFNRYFGCDSERIEYRLFGDNHFVVFRLILTASRFKSTVANELRLIIGLREYTFFFL